MIQFSDIDLSSRHCYANGIIGSIRIYLADNCTLNKVLIVYFLQSTLEMPVPYAAYCKQMSRLMGKPTICIGENKDADQLRGNREVISAFVFATRTVQFLFYLNPKFQASSSFLCLYSSVCVGPVRKPHCWFSHEAAQMFLTAIALGGSVILYVLRFPMKSLWLFQNSVK